MRRVDRRTNALPDQPTDRPTDTASYRGALSHLKNDMKRRAQRKARDSARGNSAVVGNLTQTRGLGLAQDLVAVIFLRQIWNLERW